MQDLDKAGVYRDSNWRRYNGRASIKVKRKGNWQIYGL